MIDYSGGTLPWTPDGPGKVAAAQIFVGVLPASGYIFCCATERQTRDDWLDAQIQMLPFFGGVPKHIYLDNSTSLVIKPDKYCPRLCKQYREFCDYYGTIPDAVRPGKPRDKAMVDNAVYQCQRFILTALRGLQFFSLEEINKAIGKELLKLNARPLTTRFDGFSRADLMEEEKITLRSLPLIPYELSSVSKILKVQKGNVVRFKTAGSPFPSDTWADRSRSSKAASRKQSAFLISGPGNGYGYITCAKANRKTSFCASTCRSQSVRSCRPRRNSSS